MAFAIFRDGSLFLALSTICLCASHSFLLIATHFICWARPVHNQSMSYEIIKRPHADVSHRHAPFGLSWYTIYIQCIFCIYTKYKLFIMGFAKKHRLTDADAAAIVHSLIHGSSYTKEAEKFKVSRAYIQKLANKHNVSERRIVWAAVGRPRILASFSSSALGGISQTTRTVYRPAIVESKSTLAVNDAPQPAHPPSEAGADSPLASPIPQSNTIMARIAQETERQRNLESQSKTCLANKELPKFVNGGTCFSWNKNENWRKSSSRRDSGATV